MLTIADARGQLPGGAPEREGGWCLLWWSIKCEGLPGRVSVCVQPRYRAAREARCCSLASDWQRIQPVHFTSIQTRPRHHVNTSWCKYGPVIGLARHWGQGEQGLDATGTRPTSLGPLSAEERAIDESFWIQSCAQRYHTNDDPGQVCHSRGKALPLNKKYVQGTGSNDFEQPSLRRTQSANCWRLDGTVRPKLQKYRTGRNVHHIKLVIQFRGDQSSDCAVADPGHWKALAAV